jgi:C-terminal processing protease CtpA/Prc
VLGPASERLMMPNRAAPWSRRLALGRSHSVAKPHELPNGVTIVVPSWQDLRMDETCVEGEGIAPDVLVESDAKQLETKDPILERALSILREKVAPVTR